MTDESYDLSDWKPWGDYPESGEDTGSDTDTEKPAENKPGPGRLGKLWTKKHFCFRWYYCRQDSVEREMLHEI